MEIQILKRQQYLVQGQKDTEAILEKKQELYTIYIHIKFHIYTYIVYIKIMYPPFKNSQVIIK